MEIKIRSKIRSQFTPFRMFSQKNKDGEGAGDKI